MRAYAIASFLACSVIAIAACGPSTNGHECTACGDNDCVDVDTDSDHCGDCDTRCSDSQVCVSGECTSDPGEMCDPGATEDCYSGASGTDGVGPCQGGTRTCGSNGYWGDCEGEVTPSQDMCGNGQDEDCD